MLYVSFLQLAYCAVKWWGGGVGESSSNMTNQTLK